MPSVQEKKQEKCNRRYRGKGKKSLFARIAFCADCGSGMNYIKATGGYVCGSKHRAGGKECTRYFVKHTELKAAVMNDLRKIAGSSVNSNSLIQQAMRMLDTEFEQVNSDIVEVNKELNPIKKTRMELVDKLMQHAMDDETFKMYNEGLRDKQQGWKRKLLNWNRSCLKSGKTKRLSMRFNWKFSALLGWISRMKIFCVIYFKNYLQKLEYSKVEKLKSSITSKDRCRRGLNCPLTIYQ
ncbi:zinc ribbon domain-containing protein [Paenibacillus lentus]|uniref:zinc ribbon domain-containing protein n=1 Tax=Paenibacillus lentus TaxID=1338368 RepID=UPI0036590E66